MAYRYSPIKRLQIKNFRNIGDVDISFEESPIVSLIGENEAGKTSVVKAFSVCALHSTPRDQKDFIRDGTGGFGVAIQLEDDTVVTRIKTPTLNRYTVTRPDGNNFDTTKIDGGIPTAVQEVMGLIEEAETKEYLQVRTYEDQLLFVVTPASTNYKVMYDALKVDQITRAIKTGSKEANALKASIDSNDTGIETLTNNLRAIRLYDISSLITMRDRVVKELKEIEQLSEAVELRERIDKAQASLGAISELSKMGTSEVSESETSSINDILRTLEKLEELQGKGDIYREVESLREIDEVEYKELLELSTRKERLDKAILEIGSLRELSSVEEINDKLLRDLIEAEGQKEQIAYKQRILGIIKPGGAGEIEASEVNTVNTLLSLLDVQAKTYQLSQDYEKIDTYCTQVQAYLKSIGAAVETCPKCGEDIVIDTEKYK